MMLLAGDARLLRCVEKREDGGCGFQISLRIRLSNAPHRIIFGTQSPSRILSRSQYPWRGSVQFAPVDPRPGCVVGELRSSYLPYLQALALLTQLKLLACLLNMKPSNHSSGQVLVGDDSLHTVHSLGDVTAAKSMNAYY
jgi:hypothetical protein